MPAPHPRNQQERGPGRPDIESDPEPDAVSVARRIALSRLAAAPRSRAELARAMARKQVPETAAEAVLDRFAEVGLVDDAAYAEGFVRARQADRGLARRALARDLAAKGVNRDVAEAALAGIDPEDERRTARRLVERRAAATAGLDDVRRRRRLAAMLARKGYSPGLALSVVDEVLGSADEDLGWGDASDAGPAGDAGEGAG